MQTVNRYIYPHDGRIDISSDGFLILNDYTFRHSDLVDTSETEGGILLGEGGMGKTTFLKKLYSVAPDETAQIFELGDYRHDIQGLRDDIRIFQDSLSSEASAIYIFDGYDEAPELFAPVTRLIRALDSRANVWISSRDIPAIRTIQEDRKDLKTYKLAPLSEQDVQHFAESEGIDPNIFLQKIREKGITHLCAKPMGCAFATSAYAENRLESSTTKELWNSGIRRLCDDTPSKTKHLSGGSQFPLDHIYKSAAWIALCLELTRTDSVWNGEASHCPNCSLPADKLVSEGISLDLIKETMLRGVFTPLGDGRFRFSHAEYQDYLCAEGFEKSINKKAWESLLMTNDRSGIYPERHQIAAWLTGNPAFLQVLLQTQPQLLLRHEEAVSTIGANALCERLLEHAYNLSYRDTQEENFAKYLFRLSTNNTAKILREHLCQSDITNESIELAFQIIEKCELTELAPQVLEFMAKNERIPRVRKNASYCLTRLKEKVDKQYLAQLKTFDLRNDSDDDLRGNILRCLWPDHLTPEEFLKLITPVRQKNYSGSYTMFLGYELPDSLHLLVCQEKAETVLKWVTPRLMEGDFSSIGGLARTIYSCYWREFGTSSEQIARLLLVGYLDAIKDHRNPFTSREPAEITKPALSYNEFREDKVARFRVLKLIVEETDFNLDHLPNADATSYPLYTENDFEDILDLVLQTTDSTNESRWFSCLNSILRLEQAVQHRDALDQLHNAKPSLTEPSDTVISNLTALRIKYSTQTKEWEHEREENKRKAAKSQKDTDTQLKVALSKDTNPPNYFRGISNALFTSNGRHKRDSIDLTKSHGWTKLNTTERENLIDLAEHFVRKGDIPKTEGNSFNLSSTYALHLLYSQRLATFESFDQSVWSRLAGELIKASDIGRRDCIDVLLNTLAQSAPEVAQTALLERVTEEIESGIYSVLQKWGNRLTKEQARRLLDLFSNKSVSKKSQYTLLTQIANAGQVGPCEDYLNTILDFEDENPPSPDLNHHLSLAFKLDPEKYGSVIATWLEGNTDWGLEWVTSVAGSWDSSLSSGVLKCPVQQIQRYYIWLHRHYPESTRPEHDGAYTPGAVDSIHELKSHIISWMIKCGEAGASNCLRAIFDEFPEDEWLKNCIILAHQSECSASLQPLSIDEIHELIANGATKRLINSPKDLLASVIEWLDSYQQHLQGDTPAVGEIWHTQSLIKPKDEEAFSDHIAGVLRLMSPNNCLINREVQIRRKLYSDGTPGSRTDLWIQTINPDNGESLTLCIEVKCSWNESSPSAIEEQLLKKYLSGGTATCGLLLLGWYSCEKWNTKDQRRSASRRYWPEIAGARKTLEKQATRFSTTNIPIKAHVIDCSLR